MLLTEPSSQSPFVHLFNHSFISFWTMNIYCIFLDCEPVLLTRISLEAVVWAPVSLMFPAIIIYVTAAVILFLFGAPHLSPAFPIPALESVISPRDFSFFC